MHANIEKDLLEELKWIFPHPPEKSGDWCATEAKALADLCVNEMWETGNTAEERQRALGYIVYAVWKRYYVVDPTSAATGDGDGGTIADV